MDLSTGLSLIATLFTVLPWVENHVVKLAVLLKKNA